MISRIERYWPLAPSTSLSSILVQIATVDDSPIAVTEGMGSMTCQVLMMVVVGLELLLLTGQELQM